MKTEKEFSDYFTSHCSHNAADEDYVVQISKTYWSDLTTHLQGYFEYDRRLAITQKAAHLLGQSLAIHPRQTVWANVIRDFVENNSWGHPMVMKKPKAKRTEEQKIFWQLFKYIWAFFQSMIIIKTAVYFFGLESTQHPDRVSGVWVWFFFSLSTTSLLFFAFRNYGDKDN
ncbi:MAG: hypothetical protein H7328_11775 [Bdellovibrio sp.]|nr:hypothetical protein [Bdellovibrio sp.]